MTDARDTDDPAPSWLCLLAGYVCAAAQVAVLSRGANASGDAELAAAAARRTPVEPGDALAADVRAHPDAGARARAEAELRMMSPRELRRLPGIGQARARAIARERWRTRATPAVATLERVPGIGPETARQAHQWLEKRELSP
jgi:hypothetical protein